MKRFSSLILGIFLLSVILFPFSFTQAAGASLSFSPSSAEKKVGDSFSVKVVVNSGGGAGINASDATINFDKNLLSVKSVTEQGIFTMWTTNPTFSNSGGTINYSGGLPSGPGKGYTGSAGTIMTINFTALKAGEAVVSFSAASVLANDGIGTNVLSGTSQAKFNITEKAAEKPKEEAPVTETPKTETPTKIEKPKVENKPEAKPEGKTETVNTGIIPPPPKVKSSTHPDETIWYSNNDPEYEWKLLADVSSVSFLLDRGTSSDPGDKSDGIVELKKFEDIPDGISYFHIKFQNKNGWGPTTHYKTLIDVTPPDDIDITINDNGDKTNPTPKLMFETSDLTSGLDKYRFSLDGEMKDMLVADYDKTPYAFPVLKPGLHKIVVSAFDKAGNVASSSREFIIEALKAPVITDMPKIIDKGDDLPIQGTSFYPDAVIKIYIAKDTDKDGKDAKIVETKTDPDGNWTFFQKNELDKGTYRIWAKVIDGRGAESYESMKKTLSVQSKSIVCAYGWWIVFGLVMIIIMLVGFIFYLRHVNRQQRDRAIRESRELERRLNEIFSALKEEVNELLEFADKKVGFSDSEKRVKDKIGEALDISQEFLSKEVKDVEKEIE